jgi:hypothetical protein
MSEFCRYTFGPGVFCALPATHAVWGSGQPLRWAVVRVDFRPGHQPQPEFCAGCAPLVATARNQPACRRPHREGAI